MSRGISPATSPPRNGGKRILWVRRPPVSFLIHPLSPAAIPVLLSVFSFVFPFRLCFPLAFRVDFSNNDIRNIVLYLASWAAAGKQQQPISYQSLFLAVCKRDVSTAMAEFDKQLIAALVSSGDIADGQHSTAGELFTYEWFRGVFNK